MDLVIINQPSGGEGESRERLASSLWHIYMNFVSCQVL